MYPLAAFDDVTIDGDCSGPNGDFGWAHDAAIAAPDPRSTVSSPATPGAAASRRRSAANRNADRTE